MEDGDGNSSLATPLNHASSDIEPCLATKLKDASVSCKPVQDDPSPEVVDSEPVKLNGKSTCEDGTESSSDGDDEAVAHEGEEDGGEAAVDEEAAAATATATATATAEETAEDTAEETAEATSESTAAAADAAASDENAAKERRRASSGSSSDSDFKGYQQDVVAANINEDRKKCEYISIELRNLLKHFKFFEPGENGKDGKKRISSPKLTEYAQYLGLQPAVKFKCYKCLDSSFQSLQHLNDHLLTCEAKGGEAASLPQVATSTAPSSTNFRVTRKVYLCSACGTYYENWNLFLHMREVHHRFICLFCLGMFSQLEKLSLHLVSKHGCTPAQFGSQQEFLANYADPCFLMCYRCETVFSESDDFSEHACADIRPKEAKKQPKKSKKQQQLLLQQQQQLKQQQQQLQQQLQQQQHQLQLQHQQVAAVQSEPVPSAEMAVPDIAAGQQLSEGMTGGGEEERERESAAEPQAADGIKEAICDERRDAAAAPEEVRRVPKVTLKLPPAAVLASCFSDADSDDSDKLTVDSGDEDEEDDEEDADDDKQEENVVVDDEGDENNAIKAGSGADDSLCEVSKSENDYPVADSDVPVIELSLDHPLDKFTGEELLRICLSTTVPTCVFCNHTRKIAVNGKQMGLHAIAQHRFAATVNSITAEELRPECFVARIRECLADLDSIYFNLEKNKSDDERAANPFDGTYECFQCRFATNVHKELYLHNRKMHAKSVILCIMCKSNFYSYSELICHLCPGHYVLNENIRFRCCLCRFPDLPSAFRLMVHLRKRHHACDVCLESCYNQSKLSNHVWKHKLHHLCYRCGIAYRNKPDITKHLFWKHGTESVLCKKCLQKKWPHVYHFCVPPLSFVCEECDGVFTRAVSLKVHKRLHANEKPHVCVEEGCAERFISKKLLSKHLAKHREPVAEDLAAEVKEEPVEGSGGIKTAAGEADAKDGVGSAALVNGEKEEEKPAKPVVDVYDLPALNLSESDSSDSEEEAAPAPPPAEPTTAAAEQEAGLGKEAEDPQPLAEDKISAPVSDAIWDDFKNYQASMGKLDSALTDMKSSQDSAKPAEPEPEAREIPPCLETILRDHDYCVVYQEPEPERPLAEAPAIVGEKAKKQRTRKKTDGSTSSSGSSSDSDSSSCTCGSNCSCSSSSGSSGDSSSSSDEEGKVKKKSPKGAEVRHKEPEVPILETDLETDETETDEDFYDEYPQQLMNKLLMEKRNQLLMLAAESPPVSNGSIVETSPLQPVLTSDEQTYKKKAKTKKRKKKPPSSAGKREPSTPAPTIRMHVVQAQPPPPPLPLVLPPAPAQPMMRVVTPRTPARRSVDLEPSAGSGSETDPNLRSSKRKRVPNKFYGYSSDEETPANDSRSPAGPPVKWRKLDQPQRAAGKDHHQQQQPQHQVHQVHQVHQAPQQHYQPPLVPPITIRNILAATNSHLKPAAAEDDSDDSDSELSDDSGPPAPSRPTLGHPSNENLYCYCQCPYDEVSEMIACDGSNCAIEWFHFECVGIMVPPKGKWYCPDCRKQPTPMLRNDYAHS